MRDIIIGDIHGCAEELNALIAQVSLTGDDRLILLGDLFDRGPDSWEVFQTVMELASSMGERFILLRGNHEDYLMQEKLSLMQRLTWKQVGKDATVKSFRNHGEEMESARPWLTEYCVLFTKGEGWQAVHAGLLVDPIEMNDTNTLIHDHEIVKMNIYSGPLTVTSHIALQEPMWFPGDQEDPEILPYNEDRPLPERGVICIDTGAGKGGRLTAMIIENGIFRLETV